jgi:hypothetical protein
MQIAVDDDESTFDDERCMKMIRDTFANLIKVGSMNLDVIIDTYYEDRTATYDDDEIRKVRWLVAIVPHLRRRYNSDDARAPTVRPSNPP